MNNINNIVNISLPFAALILGLASVVIGLDVIWRVQRRLKRVMLALTFAVFIIFINQVGLILGLNSAPAWPSLLEYSYVLVGLVFLFAFIEMYEIIKFLEDKSDDESK